MLAGNRVRIYGTFYDVDGALFDPTTPQLRVKHRLSTTTYSTGSGLTRISVGKYYADHLVDKAGDYVYTWLSTSSGEEAAEEGTFSATAQS